jgi:DNA-binding transcriptional regulator PaaX
MCYYFVMIELGGGKLSVIGAGLLKALVTGGLVGVAIIAPNAVTVFDKPIRHYLEKLDAKDRRRELKRAVYYAKRRGWVEVRDSDYQHGLQITEKGRRHLQKVELDSLVIPRPKQWDRKWRLVFYDIPEKHKAGRDALVQKLKGLGFYTLQRSILVHPFPCRAAIEAVTAAYKIEKYVSYIETDHIDQQGLLLKKFTSLLKP